MKNYQLSLLKYSLPIIFLCLSSNHIYAQKLYLKIGYNSATSFAPEYNEGKSHRYVNGQPINHDRLNTKASSYIGVGLLLESNLIKKIKLLNGFYYYYNKFIVDYEYVEHTPLEIFTINYSYDIKSSNLIIPVNLKFYLRESPKDPPIFILGGFGLNLNLKTNSTLTVKSKFEGIDPSSQIKEYSDIIQADIFRLYFNIGVGLKFNNRFLFEFTYYKDNVKMEEDRLKGVFYLKPSLITVGLGYYFI